MLYLVEKSQFILPVSAWWLFICILVGIGAASIVYLRHKFPDGSKLKLLLSLLRGISFALIAALLLNPFFRSRQSDTIDPVLLILKDNSSSIKESMSAESLAAFNSSFLAFEEKITEDFDTRKYAFGTELKQVDSLDYTSKTTDIAQALKELMAENINQHLGGIVLVSDGIYNSGINPLYANLKEDLPIYTIGIGDTSENIDLLLQNVRFNKTIYTGDEFEVKFDVMASNLQGRSSRLEVSDNRNKKLFEKQISIDNNDFIEEFSVLIKAKEPGIQKFNISLSNIEEEITLRNNSQTFYVEVIDGRQEIVMLYDAPHPDVKALRQAVELKENYSFSAKNVKDFIPGETEKAGIFIFHGCSSNSNVWSAIVKRAKEERIPTWFILSPNFDASLFNNAQSIAKMERSSGRAHEIFPALNTDFNYFNISNSISSSMESYPPLQAPLLNVTYSTEHQSLLNQKIAGQVEPESMLWLSIDGTRRIATLVGEGIWRWRMTEFSKKNSADNFDQLFGQIIQYLGVKEDRRKFRVETNKNVFQESEQVILTSLLYNKNYELENSNDVFVTLTSSDGTEYDYVLNKSENAYELNVGNLAAGSYTVKATTNQNGKTLNATYSFTVEPVYLEELSLQADHRLLHQLSESTGGKIFKSDQLGDLEEAIRNDNRIKPILSSTFSTKPILEYEWLLIAIVLLLSLEWFLRKYYGSI